MRKFLALLSSFSGLFLLVASLANFVLAYKAVSVVNAHSVTNFVESVTFCTNSVAPSLSSSSTNFPSSVSPFAPPSPSVFPPDYEPKQVALYPYDYFLVGRRIGVRMFGRYYYEGSPCSVGRIAEIYPDRIILSNGDWIQNKLEPRHDDEPQLEKRLVRK